MRADRFGSYSIAATLAGHAVLRPLEVDDAVAALVAAALVARRDPAVVVPAARLLQRLEQALLRLGLRDLLEGRDGHEAAAGRRRLVLARAPSRPVLLRRSRSSRPRGSARWPSSSPACGPCCMPRRFGFGWHLGHVDAQDVDVEQLLDGLAHLRPVRVLVDLERVPVLVDQAVALLGHDRSEQDLAGWRLTPLPGPPLHRSSALSVDEHASAPRRARRPRVSAAVTT